MVADSPLSPIETARAKLQDQIGLFLSSRQKLMNLMKNPNLQIQGQARGLYAVQTQLETQLQNDIYPKLAAVQSGTWSVSDVITLGGFTAMLMKQINDVQNLERAGGGPSSGFDVDTLAIGIPVLVVVGLLGGYMLANK
jgi:uncharacterized protein YneF (UPF0154 family)/predicted CopG family antitoxin